MDPQNVCDCHMTDYRDCDLHGCYAEPGHRDYVWAMRQGEYDHLDHAAAERDELLEPPDSIEVDGYHALQPGFWESVALHVRKAQP